MYRYHAYKRNSHKIGEVPATTLRRWRRLEALHVAQRHDNYNQNNENLDQDYNIEFENVEDESEEEESFISLSSYPSMDSLNSEVFESDSSDELLFEDNQANIFDSKLHNHTDITVGEAIFQILDFYKHQFLKKKSLYGLLKLIDFFLPKPNNLPKSRHFLMKYIDSILPKDEKIIKRHRFCEDCNEYLFDWDVQPRILKCTNCSGINITGLFIEYNLHSAIKHAFECRNLKQLVDDFQDCYESKGDYIDDITSAKKYQSFRSEIIRNKYDLCLIWNTDGVPFTHSSNGQIWLIQAQIFNIHHENRRNYQFVCGIYYNTIKKPTMNSFLYPFVESLKKLSEEGIKWQDNEGNLFLSKVIAPVATLDAPARAAVQNIMQYNGEFGFTFCEHQGETCKTGSGFNRVYCSSPNNEPIFRTKERMYAQARAAVNDNLYHVQGVKGPSIAALIPFFNVAESFVPDYMHCILLGVSRMLFNLWFNSKYKEYPYYIKKSFRDEIDEYLKQIYPPDYITRTPRLLHHLKFFKASELRECLIYYFPILLKDRLAKKYYDHFLLLVYATRLVMKTKIHVNLLETADTLFKRFVVQVEQLYGRNKCTFNVHQLTHIVRNVHFWGPVHSWSTFAFEDGNGYIKKITHGANKLDMEIANMLKIFNVHQILKHKLEILNSDDSNIIKTLGKTYKLQFNENELSVIERYCLLNNVCSDSIKIFTRIKIFSTIITSEMYKKQKKRNNFYVYFGDSTFGSVLYFLKIDYNLVALIRRLVNDPQMPKIQISNNNIDFSNYIIPFRETHCLYISPVDRIKGKLVRINNYLCLTANLYEQK